MQKDDLSYLVIGCAMAVHNELGCGFQKDIYQRALSVELQSRGVPHICEFKMPIVYKGEQIGTRQVDFFINSTLMVELKALSALEPAHLTEAKNFLDAYNLESGLLLNFGTRSLEIKNLFA